MNALRQAAETLLDLTAKIDEQLAELVFKLQDLMARMAPDDRQAVEARYQSILRDRQERYAEKAKMRSLKEVKGTVSTPRDVLAVLGTGAVAEATLEGGDSASHGDHTLAG